MLMQKLQVWLDKPFQFLGLNGVPKVTGKEKPDYLIGLFLLVGSFLIFLAILVALKMLLTSLFLGGSAENSGMASLGLGALVVALLSAPFVIWRSWVAHQDYKVKEQGHITDRLNKAVEGLGAEKTVKQVGKDSTTNEFTQPNLEVRIGAIYALERIAQDSLRDHIQIMEILCAYIRETTQRIDPAGAFDRSKNVRLDIQIALTVIGRRTDTQLKLELQKGYELDLTKVDIDNANLRGLNFCRANFTGASLQGVNFIGTNLAYTRFLASLFEGAIMENANLESSGFYNLGLTRVNLKNAKLKLSEFGNVSFFQCHLEGLDFSEVKSFSMIKMRETNLSLCKKIESHHLNEMFADVSVILPKGMARPNHWQNKKLDENFEDEYQAWLYSRTVF